MRAVIRVLLRVMGAVVVLVVLILGLLTFTAYRALPVTQGEIALDGLAGSVTVARDAHGIPLITAQSQDDAYFALGYVHAQDRLFEMELLRRQGQGRLAELIGAVGVGPDTTMRTLGIYRRAEDDLKSLGPETVRAFERYAAGVNAWLGEGHPLPLEYQVLWFKPEPWRPADSLVWQKLMGLQLSGNWSQELAQAALVAKLGPEKANALTPTPRATDPVTMSQQSALSSGLHFAQLFDAMTAVIKPTSASNIWAIAGNRTDTGKPIVANDPHLGFQSPSVWYFVGIDAPGLKLFGATVPGVPFHMIGHNHHVGWGFTTPESDTADLFIEQITADGTSYETPEGPKPFESRTEVITVRFGDPVALTLRETRHGPVVSDILQTRATPEIVAGNRVLALSAGLFQPGDRSAEGVYRMNRAEDVAAFVEAIKLFHAPQQNMMFADTAGTIGYYAPGRVPIRKAGDGTVPVPGWSGEYDWSGFIPFEELPHDIAPSGGLLVNANNKMVRDDYPHMIAANWSNAYRAARIDDLLRPVPASGIAATQALQSDVVSLMARDMLPLMLARLTPNTDRDRMLMDKLKTWDGAMDRDRPEPLVFALWIEKLKSRILADDLGDLYRMFGGTRPEFLSVALTEDAAWCDDVTTPTATETCEQQVTTAWSDAMAWLDTQGTADATAVRWGDFHVASFGHLLFQNFPGIGWLGNQTAETGGDGFTVNRGSFSSSTARVPFRHFHGASLRAVYDFSDLSRSRFALAGGQSGHLTSLHYGDLLEPWRDGLYFEAPTAATAVENLTLRAAKP